ncbi:MAG: hypothetical protein RRZ68_03510, partial [Oscillospiraceae bacterium]
MKKFLSVILAITIMAMMAVPAFAGAKVDAMAEGPAKKIAQTIISEYAAHSNETLTSKSLSAYVDSKLTTADLVAAN